MAYNPESQNDLGFTTQTFRNRGKKLTKTSAIHSDEYKSLHNRDFKKLLRFRIKFAEYRLLQPITQTITTQRQWLNINNNFQSATKEKSL